MPNTQETMNGTAGGKSPQHLLVIGATGHGGRHVAAALAKAGYEVSALQRPGGTQVPPGYRAVPGDLKDPASLTAAARECDLVVHVGSIISAETDIPAAKALIASGTPLVYTSSTDVLGMGFTDESSPHNPHPIVGWRDVVEDIVVEAGGRVIRAGMLYGNGGGVVQDMMIPLAARVGAGVYIGEPGIRWSAVHVEDLGELYPLVIERAAPGTIWHGVGETARIVDIVAAVGHGVARSWPITAEPPAEYAEIAGLFQWDQDTSSEKTRREMGWHPVHNIVDYVTRQMSREK